MDGKRTYQIVINGVNESIEAVASLNRQLDDLSQKISKLENKTISVKGNVNVSSNVTTSTSGDNGGAVRTLSEEVALQKELNKLKNEGTSLEAKQIAYQDESYQKVLAQKDVLKEIVEDQKAIAAQERLQADTYSNTMQGMKQKLADLKSAINTTDLGDAESIKKMTQEANELTNKLKEMEEAYGTFSRNVGNYASVTEGLGKISVVVNGVTQDFDNLRQAQRALSNAMGELEFNGKQDTEMYKQMEKELEKVAKAQLRLNSAMSDAKASSKIMDELLDTLQSFVAIGQVSKGLSTFFGIDNSAVEQQIAKLVALQNVMQGIEKIRQQMNTGEGIGGFLSAGSNAVDKFVMKLTGAEKRMGMLIKGTREETLAVQRLSAALKVLGGAAIAGGIILAVNAINKLMDDFKYWKNGGYEAGTATEVLNKQLEIFNNNIERIKKIDLDLYLRGLMTSEEYATESTKNLANAMLVLLHNLENLQKVDFSKPTASILGGINIGYGKTEDEALLKAEARFDSLAKKINKIENISGKGNSFTNWIKSFVGFGDDLDKLTREFQYLGESLAQNTLYNMKELMTSAQNEIKKTGKVSDETKSKIKELSNELKYDETQASILNNVDKFTKKGQYYVNQINLIKGAFIDLGNSLGNVEADAGRIAQLEIDAMKDGLKKQKKQIELNRKKELADVGDNMQLRALINAKYEREILNAEKSFSREMAQAYADLADIKIQLMREGWNKEQEIIRNERDERIRQVKESEKLVGQRVSALRELYRQKELDAERDWAYEVLKINQELFDNIESIERSSYTKEASNAEQNIKNKQNTQKNDLWESTINPNYKLDINSRKAYYDEILKIDKEASEKQKQIREENLWRQYSYDKKDEEQRHEHVVDMKTYSLVMGELSKIPTPTNEDYVQVEQKLSEELRKMRGELVDAYNQGKLDFKTFCEYIEKEENAHISTMTSLQNEYNINLSASTQEALDEQRQLYSNYYSNLIAVIRQNQDKVNEKMEFAPVQKNDWGIVQLSKTKQIYRESLKEAEDNATKLKGTKIKLKNDLAVGNITYEDWFMRDQELDSAIKANDKTIETIKDKQKNLVGDFVQSIQGYLNSVVDSFSTIMNAVWDAQDREFEHQQEELDKWNEELETALDKQQEIVQSHKDAINDIEDELSTARGDRRSELIERLNAEVAAQKKAAKEEERIKKEQEKAQAKEDALQKKREEAEYNRQILQAIVNGAMAVTMAAVNKWPVPAIPMMALAASTTAAQLAIMKQNRYAKGGLLEGPSHSQGGVKVYGGYAELEGHEYIVNKHTTIENEPLLEYINSKQKKLSLDDFVDFYSSKQSNIRKVIASASPRAKFAEGGLLTFDSSNVDTFNNRLLDSFERYSNRPVVVAVTEIEDKMADVHQVRALAGLPND